LCFSLFPTFGSKPKKKTLFPFPLGLLGKSKKPPPPKKNPPLFFPFFFEPNVPQKKKKTPPIKLSLKKKKWGIRFYSKKKKIF